MTGARASRARKVGLSPIVGPDTRLLFLGSFPGEESLRQRQYYAHPQNQFWRLVGELLGEPLPALCYAERIEALRRHRVGVWDVITRCRREGSLDGAIRDAQRSDFDRVRRVARSLELVCFNGQTAGRAESDWRHAGYATRVLPSSSPAYTMPYAEKLREWRAATAVLPPLP